MLTAEEIAALRDAADRIAAPITEYLLRDIVRRIAEAGQLTSTAQYQTWILQMPGRSRREIERALEGLLQRSRQEIERLLYQSAQSGYDLDLRRFPTVEAIPFEENLPLQQLVSAAVKLAREDFTNLTQTLGMVDPFGNALPLQEAYRACTDFAFQQVITGAASYTEAVRQATRHLAAKGVRVIDYASGVHTGLEAAVRRSIMGGLGLMQEQISRAAYEQLGCDGWEITAHANSAPDHEPIQGKQYPDAAYRALNGSLRRPIGTLNCGHAAFPILLGVSRPQYTREELEKLRADNEKGVTVDGVHYTGYQATQLQRRLERAIRAQKRRVTVDKAAGDQERLAQDQTRLAVLHQRYGEFSKAANLRTQYERTEVAGVGERAILKPVRPLDKSVKTATISTESASEVSGVTKVCDLDIEKYRCVSPDIRTSEVIITDERIRHIQERHPKDYERFCFYIPRIIAEPDYIIEANKAHTAVILKEISENMEKFKLILHLKTPEEPENYKNSIISFWKIGDTTWKKAIKNKKILYKSE